MSAGEPSGPDPALANRRTPRWKSPGFWILLLFISSVVLCVASPFLLIGTAMWSNKHPETGVNVVSVDWLPQTASNISYYRTYSWTAYEFDMVESDFREWAAGHDLKEIEKRVGISRFSWKTFRRTVSEGAFKDSYHEEENKHFAWVSAGLFDISFQDNGRGYALIYDRNRGRAYFQSQPR